MQASKQAGEAHACAAAPQAEADVRAPPQLLRFDVPASCTYRGGAPLWSDLLTRHAAAPFAALVGGGDQLYSDDVWQVPALQEWLLLPDPAQRLATPFTAAMAQQALCYYMRHCATHFSEGPGRRAFASIPQVNTWDDHDIFACLGPGRGAGAAAARTEKAPFQVINNNLQVVAGQPGSQVVVIDDLDRGRLRQRHRPLQGRDQSPHGWGSYPRRLADCPVFRGVFAAARAAYLLFQQHTTAARAAADGLLLTPGGGAHLVVALGPRQALLLPDQRGERTKPRFGGSMGGQGIRYVMGPHDAPIRENTCGCGPLRATPTVGPLIRFRGYDAATGTWRASVLYGTTVDGGGNGGGGDGARQLQKPAVVAGTAALAAAPGTTVAGGGGGPDVRSGCDAAEALLAAGFREAAPQPLPAGAPESGGLGPAAEAAAGGEGPGAGGGGGGGGTAAGAAGLAGAGYCGEPPLLRYRLLPGEGSGDSGSSGGGAAAADDRSGGRPNGPLATNGAVVESGELRFTLRVEQERPPLQQEQQQQRACDLGMRRLLCSCMPGAGGRREAEAAAEAAGARGSGGASGDAAAVAGNGSGGGGDAAGAAAGSGDGGGGGFSSVSTAGGGGDDVAVRPYTVVVQPLEVVRPPLGSDRYRVFAGTDF
ncbi:hypothetical protein TSOC_007353 [Tetrabaena socialis]|uniref:PhoD-like phosphatase domain-containing protein n=1 Tax=Tetrabaena socialis TaxID=47790 RepID=A0A2J8A197_9CHLO|nr:hypothetical protein TSOC_007353 [Tetrabaena socialis]|eukprot:PNH06294.1 hypothetical protein TSOC_007353 [Tetrabaena socialis]